MNEKRITISVEDIIRSVLKNRALIITSTVLGLLLGITLSIISYTRGEMSKEYVITSTIAVTSQNEDGLFTSKSNDPDSQDIYLAENMVDSVIYVMKSDTMLDAAIDSMKLVGISTKDIYNNLQLSQYNETQIIELTLYWRNSEEGVQILNALNSVAPRILIDTLKLGDVSIVNQPSAKYRIGGKVNASLWLYTAIVGLAIGFLLSILKFLISPTLTNVKDVKKGFGMELLGNIPDNRVYFGERRSPLSDEERLAGADVSEEYRLLNHLLLLHLNETRHKIFYITSSQAHEGKTTVTANLGARIAESGKKVLLVDFDVRNPTLGRVFLDKVSYKYSLNALYRGDIEKEDAITHITGNLDLLPAILERKELTLSDSLIRIVKEMAKDYDLVLLDTCPIGMVSDTMNLNQIADEAIFVIRFDYAPLSNIYSALDRMEKSGIEIWGCILNRVKDLRSIQYNKYYKGYYKNYRGNSYQVVSVPEVVVEEDAKDTQE